MTTVGRRGVTLVEVLVVTSIIGILTALVTPAVLGVKRSSIANQAVADLRAVDMAVQSSCGRGRCGDFTTSSSSAVAHTVPADLKLYLPLGFTLAQDTATYAMEVETWQMAGNPIGPGICVVIEVHGCRGFAVATWSEGVGFTNTAGFSTPNTIYVTVSVVTSQRDVAQDLYSRAGGVPPVFISSKNVWKYSYPVLVGVPATG